MKVCLTCGVELGASRSGVVVHLGEIPEGVAWHDPEAVEPGQYQELADRDQVLAVALLELADHHDTLCPPSSCPFSQRARAALTG